MPCTNSQEVCHIDDIIDCSHLALAAQQKSKWWAKLAWLTNVLGSRHLNAYHFHKINLGIRRLSVFRLEVIHVWLHSWRCIKDITWIQAVMQDIEPNALRVTHCLTFASLSPSLAPILIFLVGFLRPPSSDCLLCGFLSKASWQTFFVLVKSSLHSRTVWYSTWLQNKSDRWSQTIIMPTVDPDCGNSYIYTPARLILILTDIAHSSYL